MLSEITEMSATALSHAIRAKTVSCVEVMTATLDQIDRLNPTYNAIVALRDRDVLLGEARAADADLVRGADRGWMHGMPQAVKDLSDVRGLPTTSGSVILCDAIAAEDSLFVKRMRAAGAIFIGKTNTPEFGLGSQTTNRVYGTTRNAYDPRLTSGGSSGGAAVAIATGMLSVADGSDMMGSLRNPAAFNNLIGLRPSQGRVPHVQPDPFFQQLGVQGAMGRSAEDVLRLLGTQAGYDPAVPLSLRDVLPGPEVLEGATLKGQRIGWMGDLGGHLAMEDGLLSLCENALRVLESAGAHVEPVAPAFDMDRLWQTWCTLRHWTVCGVAKPLYDQPQMRAELSANMIWEIEHGLRLSGPDISAAGQSRSAWYRVLLGLFDQFDALILPSAQVFAFDADIHAPTQISGRAMDTYHRWMEVTIGATLAGCPAVNVPVGFDGQGRAMGMQCIGPFGADAKMLALAAAYEACTDHLSQRPVLT